METDDGVVAIDGGLLVSDARAFRARLDALHKPLLAVLVTHGHPDHVNGVVELVRGQGDVPIYATPEGKAVIDDWFRGRRARMCAGRDLAHPPAPHGEGVSGWLPGRAGWHPGGDRAPRSA